VPVSRGKELTSSGPLPQLKYSNIHGQLRALTILKALVENCGPRFQSEACARILCPDCSADDRVTLAAATFANERLLERIKVLAGDPNTEPQVKKKVMSVLGSWHVQFKDDPKMQLVAGLYKSCGGGKQVRPAPSALFLSYARAEWLFTGTLRASAR